MPQAAGEYTFHNCSGEGGGEGCAIRPVRKADKKDSVRESVGFR